MEFTSGEQETVYRQVGAWFREIYGESVIARDEIPSYVVLVGAGLAQITVLPWPETDDSVIRVVSLVVRGPDLDPDLTGYLLSENDDFRFGAFVANKDGDIGFRYSLFGSAVTKGALQWAVQVVAATADRYADEIVARWGGQTAVGGPPLFDP